MNHEVVYRNARIVLDNGGHVEIVYLVVTNTNDFEECADWIIRMHLDKLEPKVPLHIVQQTTHTSFVGPNVYANPAYNLFVWSLLEEI